MTKARLEFHWQTGESLQADLLNILHSNYIKTILPAETACLPHQRPCTPDLVIILSFPVLLS
jgi:hypothetical protein